MTALVAAGRWDEVDELSEHVRLNGIVARDGGARRPGDRRAALRTGPGSPDGLYELSNHQSDLTAAVTRVAWRADQTLDIEGWAFIRGVDLADQVPELDVWLVDLAGGARIQLDVRQRARPEVSGWANHANHRYDQGGFELSLRPTELINTEVRSRWQFQVRVRASGVERSGAIHHHLRTGTYDRMPSAPVLIDTEPSRLVPSVDPTAGFVLDVRIERVRAIALESNPHGRLSGVLSVLRPLSSPPVRAVLFSDRAVASVPLEVDACGHLRFEVRPPDVGETLSLRVATEGGRMYRVCWSSDATAPHTIRAQGSPNGWRRTPRGLVQVITARQRCRVTRLEVRDTVLTIEAEVELLSRDELWRAEMVARDIEVRPNSVEELEPSVWRLEFPLTRAAWHNDEFRALPTGRYRFHVPVDDGQVAMVAGPEVLAAMPEVHYTSLHRLTVGRPLRSTRLQVVLQAPLRELERSRVHQRQLAQRYRETDFEPADQVLFQCYRGEFATDSQLAIHEELRRRGAPLDLVWGVSDHSVAAAGGCARRADRQLGVVRGDRSLALPVQQHRLRPLLPAP